MTGRTREPQYQIEFDSLANRGPILLGPGASHIWRSDPRRMGIMLARYKFCSKMLAGKASVIEVGCGDGFATRVLLQEVGHVHGVDFDPLFIEAARATAEQEQLAATFSVLDLTETHSTESFDAAYALDVIEHIPVDLEQRFVANICRSLPEQGVLILGTPNQTAHTHASVWSQQGHINLKTAATLRALLQGFFYNVFLFSMNDEVVHSGFYPMAHYLLAMGVGVRRDAVTEVGAG